MLNSKKQGAMKMVQGIWKAPQVSYVVHCKIKKEKGRLNEPISLRDERFWQVNVS